MKIRRQDIKLCKENTFARHEPYLAPIWVQDVTPVLVECHPAIAEDKLGNTDYGAVHVSVLEGEVEDFAALLAVLNVDFALVGDEGAIGALVLQASLLALRLQNLVLGERLPAVRDVGFGAAVNH